MNKRDLARAVKENAAGLIEAMDLEELLGSEVFDEIADDDQLLEFAAYKARALAARIRAL